MMMPQLNLKYHIELRSLISIGIIKCVAYVSKKVCSLILGLDLKSTGI